MSRYLVYFLPGVTVPSRMKYVDDATGPPDVTDDAATLGVTVGSLWIDTAAPAVYVCADASTGAAVWVAMGGGTADLEDLETDLTVTGSKTVDRDDAPNHYLVLTGNTVLDATSTTYTGGLLQMLLLIQQDGTGGRTLDTSAIEWTDGEPTMPSAADALLVVPIFSMDNGATWFGVTPGSGGSGTPATTVESETTFGLSPAVGTDTEYARQDHTHGTPPDPGSASNAVGPLLIADDHSTPLVFADILLTEDEDDFLYADP